jgi:hypothetical protein
MQRKSRARNSHFSLANSIKEARKTRFGSLYAVFDYVRNKVLEVTV